VLAVPLRGDLVDRGEDVINGCDISACLLVQPPTGQVELGGHRLGFPFRNSTTRRHCASKSGSAAMKQAWLDLSADN
jgi:hypothetical protein